MKRVQSAIDVANDANPTNLGLAMVASAQRLLETTRDLLEGNQIVNVEEARAIIDEGIDGASSLGRNISKLDDLRKDFIYMMAPLLPYGSECRTFKVGTMSCQVSNLF